MKTLARLRVLAAVAVCAIVCSGAGFSVILRAAPAPRPSSGAAPAVDSLSGTITGRNGAAVAGATVTVTIDAFSQSATTDAQGHYVIDAVPGSAFVQISGSGPGGVAPSDFYLERYNVAVSGPTTLDVALAVVQVTGTVTNPDSSPAVSATLLFSTGDFSSDGRSMSDASTVTTVNGTYSVLLLAGSVAVTVVPSSSSQLLISQGFEARSDTAVNFSFVSLVTLQGTVRGRNGLVVPNAIVQATVGSSFDVATTDPDGHYSLQIAPGTAFLQVSGNGPSGAAPDSFYLERYNVAVSGATVFDLDLPVVNVNGAVSSTNGVEAPGTAVNLSTFDRLSDGLNVSSAAVSTDSDGIYSALVLAGNVDATLTPSSASGLLPLSQSFVASADLAQNFTLAVATQVSGIVRGPTAVGVPNAVVSIGVGSTMNTTTTDVNGQYSVFVPSGTGFVLVSGGGSAGVPSTFSAERDNVTIDGSTTVNFDLPAVQVNGSVVDGNGVPVPDVNVSTSTNTVAGGDALTSTGTAVSGPDGRFSYLLFVGDGQADLSPAASSGFADTTVPAGISGDLSQRLTIQHLDVTPPDINGGPVVVHLSAESATITWRTNRPATSTVEFGIGVLTQSTDDAALVVDHAVTLTGLAAATPYAFRVGSTDGSGNGPAFSAIGTFTTQASPGDQTAPVFSSGPAVVFVDDTSALIEWTTDEPASSLVEMTGPPATVVDGDPGHFRFVHRVQLTGLTADTDYSAKARSADPDGNAADSPTFTFHTATAPDTTAPIIVAGPVVIAKTDTRVVVAWTTNEPATSGVSFNDGTAYDLTGDASLTRNHQMTLSGLASNRTYHVTVSSTDADGNGPALSGVLDVTTDATPDATAPVVSNVQVSAITDTSATVTFTTDELANGVVQFGAVSGAPDGAQADLSLSASHQLVLNGLQPGTTYYFVVLSTDVAGNTGQAAEATFVTKPPFVDLPPSPPGPVTVPPSPTRATTIHISWGASTDDFVVLDYEVLRDGTVIGTVDGTTLAFDDTTAPEGTHVYRIGAQDAAHTTLSDPATVIIDRTAPTLTLPANIDANAIGTTATVVFSATATDNVDPAVVVTCLPASGSAFPVGPTTVSCSATDTAGNVATGSFIVTVHDVTGPVVTMFAPSLVVLWPPNHQMVSLFIRASATDAIDPAPVCQILSISSNEPISGLGDGDTAPDWAFSGLSFQLRAERSGTGSGRIYTINGQCADASGNTTAASTTVRVPKGPNR